MKYKEGKQDNTRYFLVDFKTNKTYQYTNFQWYAAFILAFLFGFMSGFLCG